MLRKLIVLFLMLMAWKPLVYCAPKEESQTFQSDLKHEGILTINENFYMGKIPHKHLWIVMERVSDDNVDYWLDFSAKHGPKNSGRRAEMPNAGLKYFQNVLSQVSYADNEMWITYVTDDPCTSTFDVQKDHGQVKMYISVTSSPQAKITSHVGISKTVESFTSKQYPGIGMHLQAFAAKVMLIRNPERRYMITAPEVFMETILSRNLPEDKLFIGTRELVKGYKNDDRSTCGLHTLYELGKVLKKERYKDSRISDLDTVLIKHPPIISAPYQKDNPSLIQSITIYKTPSSNEPWLVISQENPAHYRWMFESAFVPIHTNTHYVVVDLKALATCRNLDPLENWQHKTHH